MDTEFQVKEIRLRIETPIRWENWENLGLNAEKVAKSITPAGIRVIIGEDIGFVRIDAILSSLLRLGSVDISDYSTKQELKKIKKDFLSICEMAKIVRTYERLKNTKK